MLKVVTGSSGGKQMKMVMKRTKIGERKLQTEPKRPRLNGRLGRTLLRPRKAVMAWGMV